MKRLLTPAILIILLVPFILGNSTCTGLQVEDDATYQVLGYASGKGMGYAFARFVSKGDLSQASEDRLNEAWDNMMNENASADPVDPKLVTKFFNYSLFVLAGEIGDPYGAIQDLGVLLTIYGAQYDDQGQLIGIQPVPLTVMEMFEMGYVNGYMVGSEK
jgi:hypothetical protein